MEDLIKENVRTFQWAVFNEAGLMLGLFKHKSHAIEFQTEHDRVSRVLMEPVLTMNKTDPEFYPVECYITLLALPKDEL